MIGQVEELAPELQVAVFAPEREAFEQGEIEIGCARADHHITSRIAKAAGETAAEIGRVEPLRRVMTEIVRISVNVRTGCGIGSGERCQSNLNVHWIAGLEVEDAVG